MLAPLLEAIGIMIIASKTLMVLEGLILGYLSMLGILLFFGGSIPFFSGAITSDHFANFVSSLIFLAFLLSGWRIYFWVLLGGFPKRGHINKYWFVSAAFAVCAVLLSWPVHKYSEQGPGSIWYMQSQLFMLGLYFLPTGAHLALHLYIEKNANKRRWF